VKKSN